MWGRLAPGVSRPRAEQELLSLTNQLRKIYPAVIWDHEYIVITPGAHFLSFEGGRARPRAVGLLVFLILAIACANLGGLLMARGAGRQREIQLRFDLGARKLRVFRQLLTENLLLGLLGSIAALPLSYGVLRLVLVYSNAPSWMSALPDWRVFFFTTAMGFVAALAFWIAAHAADGAAEKESLPLASVRRLCAGGSQLCAADPGWIAGAGDAAHTVFRPWIWL